MRTLSETWVELGSRLGKFVGSKVADSHAAEDITQDVMLKVQTQLEALPPEEKLPAWVFAVARNAIIDHYRARAVRDHADVADVEPVADTDEDGRRGTILELT